MTRQWTDRDLESFHDDDLDEPIASELAASLRSDPALRARLAGIRQTDAHILLALTRTGHDNRAAATGTHSVRCDWWLPVSIAATVVLLLSVAWIAIPPRNISLNRSAARSGSALVTDVPSAVVFSLPARSRLIDQSPPPPARRADRLLLAFEAALQESDVERAMLLVDQAQSRQRDAFLIHIAEALRSANTAEEVLDLLSPDEQVRVCALWMREGAFVHVSVRRLERLAQDGPASHGAREMIRVLRTDPQLEPRLRAIRFQERDGVG